MMYSECYKEFTLYYIQGSICILRNTFVIHSYYYRPSIYRCPIQHDSAHSLRVTVPKFHSNFALMKHYNDVIMGTMASQMTSFAIVYSTIYWGTDQWKHQSFASLAFVRGIHRWPVNSPHKEPVTWKMFPFDDVIMSHPIPGPYGWAMGCLSWIIPRKMTVIYWEGTVLVSLLLCCQGIVLLFAL